jgi:hypothetical protein
VAAPRAARRLRRIEGVLTAIELRARSWGPFSTDMDGNGAPGLQVALQPQFSVLFGWYLSAMESFVCLTWLVFGKGKTRRVVLNFASRFQGWSR